MDAIIDSMIVYRFVLLGTISAPILFSFTMWAVPGFMRVMNMEYIACIQNWYSRFKKHVDIYIHVHVSRPK